MGVVWSASDPRLERQVAIKVVHPELARAPEASTRLLREARAMAKVSHRGVVTIHDAGDVDGSLFLAMELVTGTTLGAMLRAREENEPRPWRRWLTLMLEAGRGLAAAHRAGVLHRDFKPDNVLVDDGGRVCVGDFGLATLGELARERGALDVRDVTDLDLTVSGALLGTPAYMSPQQLRGEPVDARADQFSFCVATYEAVFGARPFAIVERGIASIPALIAAIDAARLREPPASSTVPGEVRGVLRRGLAPDPAARWPDMESLIAALEEAANPAEPHAPRRQRRGRWIAGAAVSLAIAGALALVAARWRSGAHAPPAASSPERLFGVTLQARVAVSHDGRRIAIASDKVEVRDRDGSHSWSHPLEMDMDVFHLEFAPDDTGVRYAHLWTALWSWPFQDRAAAATRTDTPDATWIGRARDGDLYLETSDPATRADLVLRLVGKAGAIRSWTLPALIEVFATSPDGRRFAYLVDSSRFSGRIEVLDLAGGAPVATGRLIEPTAVTWLDSDTLLYATGTAEQPTIQRARVTADGVGPATVLYRRESGWFSLLRASPGRVYFVDAQPSARARMIDRGGAGTSVQDYAPTVVAAGLGWQDGDEFLAWTSATRTVERRSARQPRGSTPVLLAGEPANATLAGELLIAAVRKSGGRDVVASSLTDGTSPWQHVRDGTSVVRCAGDRAPPCFAVHGTEIGHQQLVTLDPATGAMGTRVILEGVIDDIAVRADGQRILVSNRTAIREIDLDGAETTHFPPLLPSIRSVAYDPRGGILLAGTLRQNTYQIGRYADGRYTLLAQTDNDILSMVRPSPSGEQILVLARTFDPELWTLPLE
jgi:hypothetical protein